MTTLPSRQDKRLLGPVERFNFNVVQTLHEIKWVSRALFKLQSILSSSLVEFTFGDIVQAHGFENFQKIDPSKAVILAANHRAFYDQYVIAARLYKLYGAHHKIFFPVRSRFFYDNPLGLLVNLVCAFGVMFPPIVRDKRRLQWNRVATDLMVDMLSVPENLIGFHPEGRRNQGPDPYQFLRAKPGCGELIYRARPNVIPVFLHGFPGPIGSIIKKNFFQTTDNPLVHMVMGEPIDFTEELAFEPGTKTYLKLSRKVMSAIKVLAKSEQEIRSRARRMVSMEMKS